jgi:hypothetical protein
MDTFATLQIVTSDLEGECHRSFCLLRGTRLILQLHYCS